MCGIIPHKCSSNSRNKINRPAVSLLMQEGKEECSDYLSIITFSTKLGDFLFPILIYYLLEHFGQSLADWPGNFRA